MAKKKDLLKKYGLGEESNLKRNCTGIGYNALMQTTKDFENE